MLNKNPNRAKTVQTLSSQLERTQTPPFWCRETLKVFTTHRKKLYARRSENACNRKKSAYCDPIRSYDLLSEMPENDRLVTLLVVLDETTRDCLDINVGTNTTGGDVIEALRHLFVIRVQPWYICGDNSLSLHPEWQEVGRRSWPKDVIHPAKRLSAQNKHFKSFKGKRRNELTNLGPFSSLSG